MNILAFSILSVLLISIGYNFAYGSDVPALIWSPTRSMVDLPQVIAGKKIDADNFHSKYLVPLAKGSRAFIVFLQDKFGLDYLSRYADIYNKDSTGGALKNVKKFMEDQFSTNLPYVQEPMSAIDSLRKTFHNDLVEIHEPSKLATMEIKKDKPQLVLVHLPDLAGKKNEEATIRNNDELIAKSLKTLKDRGVDYTALLTGEQAPREEENSNYLGRHLLQIAPDNNSSSANLTGIYLDFPNCPFYAGKIVVLIGVQNTTAYNMTTVTSNSSDCGNNSAVMTFTLVSENKELTATFSLNFTISKMAGWELVDFNIDYTLKGQTTSLPLFVSDIGAPVGFSYHCTQQPLLKSNLTGPSNVMVELHNLQVQPVDARNGTFSIVWDCTGFFTIGIWMGLFSTFILALIIAFGLYMIMDIKTMDRFDDPKGKAFIVTAVDG